MRPPRALWVPFELGRPFGPPGDAAFQRRVVLRALSLLEEERGPILVDYDEEAPGGSAAEQQPWVCPVQLKAPPADGDPRAMTHGLKAELAGLMPWFERAVRIRGRTTTGVSGMPIDENADLLSGLLHMPSDSNGSHSDVSADSVRLAAEDLKAYYCESVSAQPGAVSSQELHH